MAGPTPGRMETGRGARKPCASAAPITEKPRGLSRVRGDLGQEFVGERPTETVIPTSRSISAWTRARVRAAGAAMQALGAGKV